MSFSKKKYFFHLFRQMGGDLGQVYKRLVTAVNEIEKRIPFSHHDRLGFLTFCPTNLGTTIRASVHIKVPKLAKDYSKLEEVAGKYNLQVRGTTGEHTEAVSYHPNIFMEFEKEEKLKQKRLIC